MARSFNGSSDKLIRNAALVTAMPLTIAGWFTKPASGLIGCLLAITDNASANDYFALIIRGNRTVRALMSVGGVLYAATTTAIATADTYCHAAAVFTSTTSRAAFLNGANKVSNTTNSTTNPSNLNYTSIGVREVSSPTDYHDGKAAEIGVWNIALSDAQIALLAEGVSPLDHDVLGTSAANLIAYIPIVGGSPESDLSSNGNNFTVTGTSTTNHPARKVKTTYGSFTFTGQAAALDKGIQSALQGSFALTGQSANLRVTRRLTAIEGNFTETGQPANLKAARKVTAAHGSFSESGQAANLLRQLKITAAQGLFIETGQAASLKATRRLTASQGLISLSREAANLLAGRKVTASPAFFTQTGQAANLLTNRKITASQGLISSSGQSANLCAARKLPAAHNSFIYTGIDARLLKNIPTILEPTYTILVSGNRTKTELVSDGKNTLTLISANRTRTELL